ncbi:MAG TPA: hypothetical protein VK101_02030 [Limnochordia bacterium]|nr:hypothetical protein [Limnochordia bacterium]
MDRIFALLFALYIAGSIVVAILRKLRTGPSPLPPPVAFPEEPSWPFAEEERPPAEQAAESLEVEPPPARPPGAALETPAVKTQEPEAETSTVVAIEAVEAPEGEASVQSQPAPVEGRPAAATAPVPAGAPARWAAPRAKAAAATAVTRKVGLSPAEIRRAIIVAELLGPPRALKPFSPLPWDR